MDCVYQAYIEHLDYLLSHHNPIDRMIFLTLRSYLQGVEPRYLFGGIAPYIISRMAAFHGLRIVCQTRLLDQSDYLQIAERDYKPWFKRMRPIIQNTKFYTGNRIQWEFPAAIYFSLATQHAFFSPNYVPDDGCNMSIKMFYR